MADVQTTATPRVRNKRAVITENVENGSVAFNFNDGGQVFVASLSDLPANIVRQLAVSRLHNKLMDSYADPASDPRHEAMGVFSELRQGVWSQRGEAGPKRPTLLIEALVALSQEKAAQTKNAKLARTPESIEKWLGGLSEDDVASLRKKTTRDGKPNPTYVKMEEIKARRASEKARALKAAAKGIDVAAVDFGSIPE